MRSQIAVSEPSVVLRSLFLGLVTAVLRIAAHGGGAGDDETASLSCTAGHCNYPRGHRLSSTLDANTLIFNPEPHSAPSSLPPLPPLCRLALPCDDGGLRAQHSTLSNNTTSWIARVPAERNLESSVSISILKWTSRVCCRTATLTRPVALSPTQTEAQTTTLIPHAILHLFTGRT